MMITIRDDGRYSGAKPRTITLDQMPLYAIERAMGETGEIPNDGPTVQFRLYDDDGEFCYGGTLTDDDDCLNQAAALRYAEGDVGATMIKVLREGGYVQEIA
jgi:hypothetical protein